MLSKSETATTNSKMKGDDVSSNTTPSALLSKVVARSCRNSKSDFGISLIQLNLNKKKTCLFVNHYTLLSKPSRSEIASAFKCCIFTSNFLLLTTSASKSNF